MEVAHNEVIPDIHPRIIEARDEAEGVKCLERPSVVWFAVVWRGSAWFRVVPRGLGGLRGWGSRARYSLRLALRASTFRDSTFRAFTRRNLLGS